MSKRKSILLNHWQPLCLFSGQFGSSWGSKSKGIWDEPKNPANDRALKIPEAISKLWSISRLSYRLVTTGCGPEGT